MTTMLGTIVACCTGCGMVGIHDSMTMTVLERMSQDKIRTAYVCSLTLGGQ